MEQAIVISDTDDDDQPQANDIRFLLATFDEIKQENEKLKEENVTLKEENVTLKEKNERFDEIKQENEKLKEEIKLLRQSGKEVREANDELRNDLQGEITLQKKQESYLKLKIKRELEKLET